MPRNNDDFFTGSFTDEGGRRSYYSSPDYVFGKGENALGTQSGGEIKINKPETYYDPYDSYDGSIDNTGPVTPWERYVSRRSDDQFDDSGRTYNETGQLPLFTTRHRPPVVDYMTATKDTTGTDTTAMQNLSHAAEETRRLYGERPWASDNTSGFSTPMANSAIKMGLIQGVIGKNKGELAEVTQGNNMDWRSSLADAENQRREYGRLFNTLRPGGSRDSVTGFKSIDPINVKNDYDNIREEIRDKVSKNPAFRRSSGQPIMQDHLPGMSLVGQPLNIVKGDKNEFQKETPQPFKVQESSATYRPWRINDLSQELEEER